MQLTILQIILPIIASIFCSIIKKHKVLWCISSITTIITFYISLILFKKIYNGEIITYYLGDWIPIYGIELKIDMLNSLIITLVNFIAMISVLYSFFVNEKEISKNKISGFYSLFLLCLTGLLGILITNDLFNLYVFLEISSLSSYILVSVKKNNKKALIASFEYLISGTIGATFYLFGVGLLYSITGTLNISCITEKIINLYDNKIIELGTLFIFVGLSIKIAIFPFSRWLINSYSEAPSFISIFFSGTVTKVIVYIFIRIFYTIFHQKSFLFNPPINNIIIILAFFTIIFGSIFAMMSDDIKKIFANSSVSQTGYIILMLGINSKLSLFAAIFHIINHSIIKTSLFMVIGCISYKFDSKKKDILLELNKFSPIISLTFTVLSLALVGIPLTNGFASKWYMIKAIIESNSWISLVFFSISSFLTLIYIWKLIEKIYLKKNNIKSQQILKLYKSNNKIPLLMIFCLLFTSSLTIIIGIYSKPILLVIEKFIYNC